MKCRNTSGGGRLYKYLGALLVIALVVFGGTTIIKKPKQNYLIADITKNIEYAFWGTDDEEVIAELNRMAQQFEEYGSGDTFDSIGFPSEGDIVLSSWSSFSWCVGNGLAKTFGVDALKCVFNSQVRSALKSHRWKVASAMIHKNLQKLLGKKGASRAIKKIASKALPGGLPGQIAWQVGKCGIKEIW